MALRHFGFGGLQLFDTVEPLCQATTRTPGLGTYLVSSALLGFSVSLAFFEKPFPLPPCRVTGSLALPLCRFHIDCGQNDQGEGNSEISLTELV